MFGTLLSIICHISPVIYDLSPISQNELDDWSFEDPAHNTDACPGRSIDCQVRSRLLLLLERFSALQKGAYIVLQGR